MPQDTAKKIFLELTIPEAWTLNQQLALHTHGVFSPMVNRSPRQILANAACHCLMAGDTLSALELMTYADVHFPVGVDDNGSAVSGGGSGVRTSSPLLNLCEWCELRPCEVGQADCGDRSCIREKQEAQHLADVCFITDGRRN